MKTLRRFASLAYRKATPEQWSVLTAKGKPSLSIDACATFTLLKRLPAGSFENDCGRHHEALADVKGVAVIMFDEQELHDKGLWFKIFKSGVDVCELLSTTWAAMQIKMQSPVVSIEPLPKGWVGCHGDDKGCSASDQTLPDCVTPTPEPNFTPQHQRGEGLPSATLNNHLRQSGHYRRRVWQSTPAELIFQLFLFFFPIHLLVRIAWWTTLKATELVIKSATIVNGKSKRSVTRLDIKSSASDWSKGTPRMKGWNKFHT